MRNRAHIVDELQMDPDADPSSLILEVLLDIRELVKDSKSQAVAEWTICTVCHQNFPLGTHHSCGGSPS